jgi:beta-glucuronidase
MRQFPPSSFDFFPYCGIQRPVLIYTEPADALTNLTVVTEIDGRNGIVNVAVEQTGSLPARLTLSGHGAEFVIETTEPEAKVTVPNAALWSPDAPNLYDLRVDLLNGDSVVDTYTLAIGIRTIAVEGDQLLLNGESVKLRGFGRHEDFPVVGKGLLPALIIKDDALDGREFVPHLALSLFRANDGYGGSIGFSGDR